MKNMSSAAIFLKRIMSVLCTITKAKSLALRDKTNALKARIMVLSLLKNRKFSLGSISQKIHAVLGQQDKKRAAGHHDDEQDHDDQISKAVVLYNNAYGPSSSTHSTHQLVGAEDAADDDQYYYSYNCNDKYHMNEVDADDQNNKYPDLTHSLFEEDELDLGDPDESVIDLVRNSKEDQHEDFRLEDEIDQVADLFIMKFHKRMRLQKLESFKRYQDMLQRSA